MTAFFSKPFSLRVAGWHAQNFIACTFVWAGFGNECDRKIEGHFPAD